MRTDFRERILRGEDPEKVSLEALQHYADKICDAINPMPGADCLYVIAALRKMEKAMSGMYQKEADMAGMLCKITSESIHSASIPADTPEDIVNEIYRSMKRV